MREDRLCPIIASFDAAEKLIADYADIHQDATANLGTIAINRRCAELVRDSYPCSGPNQDTNGNVHCPLSAMIGDAFAMSVYRPHPPAIPPEKVVSAETDRTTGQFL
jgi:hypothetical protein